MFDFFFFAVQVEQEYRNPNSQKRDPIGKLPHRWGQSLYIISKLVQEVSIHLIKMPC